MASQRQVKKKANPNKNFLRLSLDKASKPKPAKMLKEKLSKAIMRAGLEDEKTGIWSQVTKLAKGVLSEKARDKIIVHQRNFITDDLDLIKSVAVAKRRGIRPM